MIGRALMILVIIIGSFPVLQLPLKAMAQAASSEATKVLLDDTIRT